MEALRTACLISICSLIPAAAAAPPPVDVAPSESQLAAHGKRMYREGILPSGRPMRATQDGDISIVGDQAACISCHRRSGQGASEGKTLVLPITGTALFQPRKTGSRERAYILRGSGSTIRPAYTDETLATAIREGFDPSERRLANPMPSYALSDEELKPLIAYLKSLSSTLPPGVSKQEIHFATVVTEGVDPNKRKAMLDVLKTYIRDRNTGIKKEMPAGHGARDGEPQTFRNWRLHVWELKGNASTWPAQLEKLYRKQPVFALVSGISNRSWQPIHAFCERFEIPCLFPNTDLPNTEEKGFYSIYFNKGATLEAGVLASFLRDHPDQRPGKIVQVYDDAEWGAAASHAFKQALNAFGVNDLRDAPVDKKIGLTPQFWNSALDCNHTAVVVLWLRNPDLSGLEASGCATKLRGIYLSSSRTTTALPMIPGQFRDRIYSVDPFDIPDPMMPPPFLPIETWLHARNIPVIDERMQGNTFVAIAMASDALMRMGNNLSRERFIEQMEDMVGNASISPVYPHLSLGPNQRFASKGAYVVKWMTSGIIFPVSDWIVP